MSTSHSIEVLGELVGAGVEFPDLGLVKIKANHHVPGVDNLLTRLKERSSTNWDVPASPEYKEEWRNRLYRATTVDPATVASTGPSLEQLHLWRWSQ